MLELRPTRSAEKDTSTIRSRSQNRSQKFPQARRRSSSRSLKRISLELEDEDSRKHGSIPLSESISVPFVKSFLDTTVPQEFLQEDVKNIIVDLRVKSWYKKKLDSSRLKLTRISGAMTNAIFKVAYKGLPSLLLRVYGPNVDSIVDREYELQVLARLSMQNIGPLLYGCFVNGRIEQFLENSQALNKNDIRDWKTSQRIARRMKELHSGVPLLAKEMVQEPISWQRIDKWIDAICNSDWIKKEGTIRNYFMLESWEEFISIVKKYRTWLKTHESYSKLVFCHNDAQYGNLLFTSPVIPDTSGSEATTALSALSITDSANSLLSSTSQVLDEIVKPSIQEQSQDAKLVVIDFEYSGPNPAAFDLANHLCEWMYDYFCKTPHCTFEEKYPSHEEILNFLYSYLSHLNSNKKNIDEQVRHLYNSILDWRACVSLHWALWGIMQSGEVSNQEVQKESNTGDEKYIITEDEKIPTTCDNDASSDISSDEGVDIDSFECLLYSKEKFEIFYTDLIQLGVIEPNNVLEHQRLKKLKTKRL